MEINERIKQRRLMLKLSLKDVANKLGVAESTVSRYETKDIQNMGIDKIESLSKVLECSPSYLMGWDTEENFHNNITVSKNEAYLLKNYNNLNDLGKNKLIEYSNDLTETPKYTYVEQYLGRAAHNDFANDEEQQRLMKEDLDEL